MPTLEFYERRQLFRNDGIANVQRERRNALTVDTSDWNESLDHSNSSFDSLDNLSDSLLDSRDERLQYFILIHNILYTSLILKV